MKSILSFSKLNVSSVERISVYFEFPFFFFNIRCVSFFILEKNFHSFYLFLPLTPNLAVAQVGVSRHAHYGHLASLALTPLSVM